MSQAATLDEGLEKLSVETGTSDPLVVYISGAGRSGSTILDRAVGAIDGVESFNEMHVILRPEYLDRQLCSCGKERDECPFWTSVLGELAKTHDIERMTRLSHKFETSGAFLKMMFGLYWGQTRRDLEEYATFIHDLYKVLAEKSGAGVIVDSSKVPTRAILLRKYAGLRVRVLHLVRHPRAVAASWLRSKQDPSTPNGTMTRYPVGRTVLMWAFKQVASELLRFWAPYKRLRYEDFVENPRRQVEKLRDWVPELQNKETGFLSDFSVDLPPFHSLSGNPDRFRSGLTEIRVDEKWKQRGEGKLGLWNVALFPLMLRYGYLGD